jgi:hypothetical protein
MRIGLFLCVLVLALPAQAQIYKWQDEWGVMQYSNVAPAKSPTGAPKLIEPARPPVYVSLPAIPYSSWTVSGPRVPVYHLGPTPERTVSEPEYAPPRRVIVRRPNRS